MYNCIVADDSKVIRGVMVKILGNFGFNVLEAENGEEVINLYSNTKNIKLIIMNYKLPILDGIDVLYKIRSNTDLHEDRVCIILSSSIIKEQNIREALEGGADDYLMKPFDEDILSSKLEILGLI